VKSLIHQAALHSKGYMFSSIKEFSILNHFGVDCHPPPPQSIKQVNWIMHPSFWVKCNTDGASKDLQVSLLVVASLEIILVLF
jgi:hypothetical protein